MGLDKICYLYVISCVTYMLPTILILFTLTLIIENIKMPLFTIFQVNKGISDTLLFIELHL